MSSYKETGHAEVNGTSLYYEIAGKGEPIIMIHGNGVDTRMWDDQFDVFATRHCVLRYDARGYGKSSLPREDEPYSHQDDLKALMEHHGISKAHIIGCSWGSGVAVDFVLTYPEMSYSLIPVGPWVFGYDSPAVSSLNAVFGEIDFLLKEKGVKAAMDRWVDHVFSNALDFKSTQRIRELGYEYSFWSFSHENPARSLEPLASDQLDLIIQPTLIITADRDLDACVEIAELMDKMIQNSKKIVFKDAGHCMNIDKPDEFNQLVLSFVEDH